MNLPHHTPSVRAERSLAARLTWGGILVALALALAYLEHLIPLQAVMPIPGVRLGLPNLVTIFALLALGKRQALIILLTRCALSGLLFGTVVSLLFSVCGGLLAFVTMVSLCRLYPQRLSLFGVCIGGAAAHNIGQIVVASVLFSTGAMVYYLPPLLVLSLLSGSLTGYLTGLLLTRGVLQSS